jgi:hypothetical protein
MMRQFKIQGQTYFVHRSQRGHLWVTHDGMTVLDQWMSDDNKRRLADKPERFELEMDRLEAKLVQRVKNKKHSKR